VLEESLTLRRALGDQWGLAAHLPAQGQALLEECLRPPAITLCADHQPRLWRARG